MPSNAILGEPHPSFANIKTKALASFGVNVVHVTDADSLLARTRDASPNVVILADELSGASGFSVCNRLRRSNGINHIPVVILVASHNFGAADAHKSTRTHADAYLDRPPKPEVLSDVLRRLNMDVGGAPAATRNSTPPPATRPAPTATAS